MLVPGRAVQYSVRHLTGYEAGDRPGTITTRSSAASDGHIAGSVVQFGRAARHHACSDSGDWVVKGPRLG